MIQIFINKKGNTKTNLNIKRLIFFNLEITYDNSEKLRQVILSNSERYIICGKINYLHNLKKNETKTYSDFLLKKILKSQKFNEINNFVDGTFLIIKIKKNRATQIITDKYCKIDLFYNFKQNTMYISNSLKNFDLDNKKEKFNHIALANVLMNFGSYVPKPNTIYNNINRLSIDQFIDIYKRKVLIKKKKLNLVEIDNRFNKNEILYKKNFKNIFFNSVKKRSSNRMNWVYISSGFDSTSILATLNHLFGNKKITAVIAEVKYSNKYGICNKFEIKRAKKICNYFKIPIKIIKVDYSKKDIVSQMREVKEIFKSEHIFSFNTNNYFQLAKYIKKNGKKGDRVFNGDISDGVQNLGFSQFATILDHPNLSFREYADKMFSYLYSPSFFKVVSQKKQFKDKIFNLIKNEKKIKIKNDIFNISKNKYLFKFLSPIFLSSSRFPFSSIYNEKLINKNFVDTYNSYMNNKFFKDVIKKIKKENLYSSIIYLYNIFHWSSGAVQGSLRSSEIFGFDSSTPFWDYKIQKFFSEMPENWGRSLELRNTKYVLKSFLNNDIDYPTSLQAGPHSYIYDIDHGWNADLDILYHSYLKRVFVKIIKKIDLREVFNSKVFNINYIESLRNKYLKNKYVYGSDLLTLKNLIIFLYFISK